MEWFRTVLVLVICGLIAIARTDECGYDVDVSSYPYQLSFLLNGSFRCSASLLSVNHAITSAWCLNKVPLEWTWSLRSSDGDQERIIGNFLAHNMNFRYDYDVVILTVSEEFVLSAALQPIAMPSSGELLSVGDVTTVTAWTSELGMIGVLKEFTIPILEMDVCEPIYFPTQMTERMYCAGVVEGVNRTCQLNGGSPMIFNNKLVGYFTVGYTSLRPDFPSAYTNIGDLRDWINAATGL